ncbi:MAG: hypothetical protein KJZ54_09000 [Phycisphaerales bacterium]|nr:hypothetical protein [Phycisphaerales bacterium]
MNLAQFFDHWQIVENPFQGEEARHDAVFARMALRREETHAPVAMHSDFEKILGGLSRPATAVVFGEKGSGKTAIRMQIADHVARHNTASRSGRVFLIAYDDLNAFLDRLHEVNGGKTPLDSFQRMRLVDHIDAILSIGATAVTDALLDGRATDANPLGADDRRALRRAPADVRRDLLVLQAVYDRSDDADARTARLARSLRLGTLGSDSLWRAAGALGWLPAAAFLAWLVLDEVAPGGRTALYLFGALLGVWAALLLKTFVVDRFALRRLAHRLRRQVRVLRRTDDSYAKSLARLRRADRSPGVLPMTSSDEQRYGMLDRLRRVLGSFGYDGVMVIIDRVDEPTLVSGDAERMRAIVWPMFNNKFLQQEGFGVKMLLPIELRYALFKESSAFFQEARLDKQNLVERLTWTGAMLYDLCDARLRACRSPAAEGQVTLLDLFAEDVTRQDLVDSLDQMHQPRDAFKLLYRCLTEHCSNVTAEQAQWRVPRLVLEHVRKQEADRVQQLYRGIRPA